MDKQAWCIKGPDGISIGTVSATEDGAWGLSDCPKWGAALTGYRAVPVTVSEQNAAQDVRLGQSEDVQPRSDDSRGNVPHDGPAAAPAFLDAGRGAYATSETSLSAELHAEADCRTQDSESWNVSQVLKAAAIRAAKLEAECAAHTCPDACPHGVPYRWNCEECDSPDTPAEARELAKALRLSLTEGGGARLSQDDIPVSRTLAQSIYNLLRGANHE